MSASESLLLTCKEPSFLGSICWLAQGPQLVKHTHTIGKGNSLKAFTLAVLNVAKLHSDTCELHG